MKQINALMQAINENSYIHKEMTVDMDDLLLLRSEIKELREYNATLKNERAILQAKINMYELEAPVRLNYKV